MSAFALAQTLRPKRLTRLHTRHHWQSRAKRFAGRSSRRFQSIASGTPGAKYVGSQGRLVHAPKASRWYICRRAMKRFTFTVATEGNTDIINLNPELTNRVKATKGEALL